MPGPQLLGPGTTLPGDFIVHYYYYYYYYYYCYYYFLLLLYIYIYMYSILCYILVYFGI